MCQHCMVKRPGVTTVIASPLPRPPPGVPEQWPNTMPNIHRGKNSLWKKATVKIVRRQCPVSRVRCLPLGLSLSGWPSSAGQRCSVARARTRRSAFLALECTRVSLRPLPRRPKRAIVALLPPLPLTGADAGLSVFAPFAVQFVLASFQRRCDPCVPNGPTGAVFGPSSGSHIGNAGQSGTER